MPKVSNEPYKRGEYIVTNKSDAYKGAVTYVCAPPGWYRRSDGQYQWDGSAGPEHSRERDKAYPFTRMNAARVADNCCGEVVFIGKTA